MYKIENLTIDELIFLEYSLFLYKQRLEDEIIETKIEIDKSVKEFDIIDNYKIHTYMLEINKASIMECDNKLSVILQSVKTEGESNV